MAIVQLSGGTGHWLGTGDSERYNRRAVGGAGSRM
jgi:hypothetical protein